MNLPDAPTAYSAADQTAVRRAVVQADQKNLKAGSDVDLSRSGQFYLASPNGQRWLIGVSNAGVLTVAAA